MAAGAYALYAEDRVAPNVEQSQAPKDLLTPEQIAERARRERPGTIQEIELEHKLGRHVYEVEMIGDGGAKWELKFDAKTGELLSTKADDEAADADDDDADDDD
jgi:uncharacterized membrane protein YkoI